MNLKFPGPSQCQGKKKLLIIGKISSGMKKVSKVSNIKKFKNNLRYIHYTLYIFIMYIIMYHYVSLNMKHGALLH